MLGCEVENRVCDRRGDRFDLAWFKTPACQFFGYNFLKHFSVQKDDIDSTVH